ncbi:MAG: carboxyl transferase domain-containing protein, partial [Pseudomonadota bacterium]|nr:carboxyl transferase domain-containing protein [Pseudomonadota bacterium]
FVCALPSTRVAVMGPAGVEFVYKKELKEIRGTVKQRLKAGDAEADVMAWQAEQEAALKQRYEKELMNPDEALNLGSISQIVMPSDLREVLCKQMDFHLSHYTPEPFSGPQREFH